MRIRSNDIPLIKSGLFRAEAGGHKWLVYDSKLPGFQIKESFRQKDEAILYCLEESTDMKSYSIAPLAPILDAVYRTKDLMEVSLSQGAPVSLPFDIPQLVAAHDNVERFKANNIMEQRNNSEHQHGAGTANEAAAELSANIYNVDKLQAYLKEKYGDERAEKILKNIAYLTKQLERTGFKEIRREDLITNILDEKNTFSLVLHTKYGEDSVKATLNLDRSDKGNYFFNNYELAVKKEGASQELEQRFKVNYGNTYSLKEAYNLMEGRSVYKQFIKVDPENKDNNQKYKAWSTMDFKNTDAKGNFKIIKSYKLKVEEALAQYPIKELLNEQQHRDLVDSIHRGNRQVLTFVKNGSEEKMYAEANPLHDALRFYDARMNKISLNIKSVKEDTKLDLQQKVEPENKGKNNSVQQKENQDSKQQARRNSRKVA